MPSLPCIDACADERITKRKTQIAPEVKIKLKEKRATKKKRENDENVLEMLSAELQHKTGGEKER